MTSVKYAWVLLLVIFCEVSNGFSRIRSRQSNTGFTSPKKRVTASTVSTVWPQPQKISSSGQSYAVEVTDFMFTLSPSSKQCAIVTDAFKRYQDVIQKSEENHKLHLSRMLDSVSSLEITVMGSCEDYPSLGMNEAYALDIGLHSTLKSESVWGILRGLETFSQLLYQDSDGLVLVNQTSVVDYPRFSYRGILLDTSRHFLTVETLKKNLDAMALNKFNTFHWHIVDEQAFPFVSAAFPQLSLKGAYHLGRRTHVYLPEDVQEVIEYARVRGIRVLPEFDTPGHTLSWGFGQLGLLTQCYTRNKPDGTYGPVNPILESSYDFIKKLFTEVKQVFPDHYIHLGGDEVNFKCWKSNPDIKSWMKLNNMTTYQQLEQYYIQRIISICEEIGYSYTVWQEVIDNGVEVKRDAVVEVWINNANLDREISKVTKKGLRTIISAPWYLDYISYGQDWIKYYRYEPNKFKGTDAQKKLIIGGEACLWGEYVDGTNLTPRLWPRASAVAERLWSAQSVNNPEAAAPRLHQHRCRMLRRGIPAEPIFPGYCTHEWDEA